MKLICLNLVLFALFPLFFFFLLLIALVTKFFHAGFLFLLTQTLVFQFMKVVSDEASFCASYGA
jgi:hypothetical protein